MQLRLGCSAAKPAFPARRLAGKQPLFGGAVLQTGSRFRPRPNWAAWKTHNFSEVGVFSVPPRRCEFPWKHWSCFVAVTNKIKLFLYNYCGLQTQVRSCFCGRTTTINWSVDWKNENQNQFQLLKCEDLLLFFGFLSAGRTTEETWRRHSELWETVMSFFHNLFLMFHKQNN